MPLSRSNLAAVALLALLPLRATAEESAEPTEKVEAAKNWSDTAIRISPLITLENHGYFRFRFNLFHRMDLGADGASGVAANPDSSSTTSESANIRLRYEPSLLVGEFLTVHARIDFLDNVVLGCHPDTGGYYAPFPFLGRSQSSPSAGSNGNRDAIRVKAAWADLRLFQRFHVWGGRIPQRFGLGIVRSDGSDPDSDFGDYSDGVHVMIRLPAAYVRAGMEFPGEGTTAESPLRNFWDPHDPEQTDDITRWVFVFDSSPMEKEELNARQHELNVERKTVLDWGMYHSLTTQSMSSDKIGGQISSQCGEGTLKPFGLDYDCYTLTPRKAFFWTPALWGRLLYHPREDLKIRIEAELAAVYGYVDYTQSFLDASEDKTRKEFFQVGAALEADVEFGDNLVEFLFGVASGDGTSNNFGILDNHTLVQPNDMEYRNEQKRDPAVSENTSVGTFVFNRDYRVDSILFREVIGAVTNAFYFKPAYHRAFLRTPGHFIRGGLSLMAAFATVAEGVPGGKRPLGLEGGIHLIYRMGNHLTVKADGAVLYPLTGMKLPGSSSDPRVAAALRLMMAVKF